MLGQDPVLAKEAFWVHATEVPEQGGLLLAQPRCAAILDPRYHQIVVFLAKHDREGSTGFILNRPAPVAMGGLMGWGLSGSEACPHLCSPCTLAVPVPGCAVDRAMQVAARSCVCLLAMGYWGFVSLEEFCFPGLLRAPAPCQRNTASLDLCVQIHQKRITQMQHSDFQKRALTMSGRCWCGCLPCPCIFLNGTSSQMYNKPII